MIEEIVETGISRCTGEFCEVIVGYIVTCSVCDEIVGEYQLYPHDVLSKCMKCFDLEENGDANE